MAINSDIDPNPNRIKTYFSIYSSFQAISILSWLTHIGQLWSSPFELSGFKINSAPQMQQSSTSVLCTSLQNGQ